MRLTSLSPSHGFTCEGMCLQDITWYLATSSPPHWLGRSRSDLRSAGGGVQLPITLYQRSKALFEFPQSDVLDLEWKLEIFRYLARLVGQARVGDLAQVEQRLVVAQEHRLQLRVAVHPQPPDPRTLYVAHQPVRDATLAGLPLQ